MVRPPSVWAVLLCLLYVFVAAPHAWSAGARSVLAVRGMVCSSCARMVESALLALPGVESAAADLKRDRVTTRYNPQQVTLRMMVQALRRAGYLAEFPAR